MNPAHSIACRKRDDIINGALKNKLRNYVYQLGIFLQNWSESK